jgi:uncharacterized iron-regulated membrane protein
MKLRILHRYVSLVFAVLWLFQAITGCLIVFRWEMDDASVAGSHAPFNAAVLGARLDVLVAQPETHVSSMWSANNAPDRFDIFHSVKGHDRTLRVDGAGNILRDRSDDNLSDGNIYDRLSSLHMALMLGDTGRFFLGFSGILLLSNIVVGLVLAWPRMGQWLKSLRAPKGKALPALLFGWHRTLGLWLAIPAFITIAAGTLLAFEDPLTALFKADVPAPVGVSASSQPIKPSQALAIAMQSYPGATLSGFSLADAETPWYKARLRLKGEAPRLWGKTTVFISAQDGKILSAYDARKPNTPARFMLDIIYPLHTGQIGGVIGRVVQLLIGVWLASMIGLGVSLWWTRKRLSANKKR